jgi:hypothetical protein
VEKTEYKLQGNKTEVVSDYLRIIPVRINSLMATIFLLLYPALFSICKSNQDKR